MAQHELALTDAQTGEVLAVINGVYCGDGKAAVTRYLKKHGYQIKYMAAITDALTSVYIEKNKEA